MELCIELIKANDSIGFQAITNTIIVPLNTPTRMLIRTTLIITMARHTLIHGFVARVNTRKVIRIAVTPTVSIMTV